MVSRLIRRSLQSLFVLFIVSIICFYFVHKMPGTPYTAMHPKPELQRIINMQIHSHLLDRPIWMQYGHWLGQMLHGDFGRTMHGDAPIAPLIVGGLVGTLRLVAVSWVIALLIAIPWAAYNSTRLYGISDLVASWIAYVGQAFPLFWLALMAQYWVSMHWLLLPASNLHDTAAREHDVGDMLLHMILPWSVMTLSLLITYLKYLRSGLVEVLPTDFVRTARAKGASERRVVLRHAMRNAVIPLLTMLGIELPNIICNAALVEVVFNIPGIGSLALNAVQQHDYTMFMAGVITVAAIAVVGNWVVDVAYTFVDPRIRSAQSGA